MMKLANLVHVLANEVKERHFSSSAALLNLIKSTEEISLGEQTDLNTMIQEYKSYKKSFVRNIKYDPNSCHLASTIEYPTLEVVEIYFGAATYDEIEKDVK